METTKQKKGLLVVLVAIAAICAVVLGTAQTAYADPTPTQTGMQYYNSGGMFGPKYVMNGNNTEYIYCINADRGYARKDASTRDKYLVSGGDWTALQSSLNKNLYTNNNTLRTDIADYQYTEVNWALMNRLAAVLYAGYPNNGTGLNASYEETQKAIYYIIYDGKRGYRDPSAMTTYQGGKANNLIDYAFKNTPSNYKLYCYWPGNIAQAHVGAEFGEQPQKSVKAYIELTKQLTGEGAPTLQAGDYTFTVTAPDGSTSTCQNQANGTVRTQSFTYTTPGTYRYTIQEQDTGKANITYDTTPRIVDVVVQQGSDGELYAYIWGQEVANSKNKPEGGKNIATVTNTYTKPSTPDPVDPDPQDPKSPKVSVTKTLEGASLSDYHFKFELLDPQGNVVQTKTTDDNGKLEFDEIDYTSLGLGDNDTKSFTYKVREVNDGQANITYDTDVEPVNITVTSTTTPGTQSGTPLRFAYDPNFTNWLERMADNADWGGNKPVRLTGPVVLDADGNTVERAQVYLLRQSTKVNEGWDQAHWWSDANGIGLQLIPGENYGLYAVTEDGRSGYITFTGPASTDKIPWANGTKVNYSFTGSNPLSHKYLSSGNTTADAFCLNRYGSMDNGANFAQRGVYAATHKNEYNVPMLVGAFTKNSDNGMRLDWESDNANAIKYVKKAIYYGYLGNANLGTTDANQLYTITQDAIWQIAHYGRAWQNGTVSSVQGGTDFAHADSAKIVNLLKNYVFNNNVAEPSGNLYVGVGVDQGTTSGFAQNVVVYDFSATINKQVTVSGETTPGTTTYTAEAGEAAFQNTYTKVEGTELSINAWKTLDGQFANVDGQFNFTLAGSEGAPMPEQVNVANNAEGLISFGPIAYGEADAGNTYTYTISEVNGGDATIAYDTKQLTVTVNVVREGNKVVAKVNNNAVTTCDAGTFANTTKTPDAARVSITLKKAFEGPDQPNMVNSMFKFHLYDSNGNVVLSAGGNGDGSRLTKTDGTLWNPFNLTFTEAGTYTYTIKEDATHHVANGDYSNVTFNDQPITVTVDVALDPSTNKLKATIDGSEVAVYDAGTFVNRTTAKPAKCNITAKKVLKDDQGEQIELQGGEFTFELLDYQGNPVVVNDQPVTATNDADGNVDFGEFSFGSKGERGFSIREVAPAGATALGNNKYFSDGIVYDCAAKQANVNVTQNSDGSLAATPAANIVIENTKSQPEIATTAKGANGNVLQVGTVEIEDVVEYRNLTPGVAYTLTGTLHKQNVDDQGNLVQGDVVEFDSVKIKGTNGCTFTPTSANGEVTMVFTVDTTDLKGENIVVFENLTLAGSGIFVTDHKDITDSAQTVTVENPGAKTGSVKIAKVNEKGQKLAGATLVLKKGAEVIQRFENFDGGPVQVDNLVPGIYTLVEENAPTGYDIADPISFTVVAGQTAEPAANTYTGTTQTAASGTAVPAVSNFAIMADGKLVAEASCVEPLNEMPSIHTEPYEKVHEADYNDLTPEQKQKIKRIIYAYAYDNQYLINTFFTTVSDPSFGTKKVSFPKAGMYAAAREAIEHTAGATYDRDLRKNGDFGDMPGAYSYFINTVANDTSIDAKVKDLHLLFFRTSSTNNQNLVPLRLFANDITMADQPKQDVPAKVRITATKTLTGKDATLAAGQFTFQLLDWQKNPVIRDGQIVTATNDAQGNIDFGIIEMPRVGNFGYHVAEVKGEDKGIVYDETVHKIVINVTKDANNVLKVGGANEATINAYDFTNKKPNIGTTAKGADGNNILPVADEVVVNDVVAYNNLKPNTKYTLTGKLYDKNTGKVIDGTEQSVEFTSSNTGTGETTMTFVVDTRKLQGHDLVAFETVSLGTDFEVKHEDPNDTSQTVTVDKPTVDVSGTKTWSDNNNQDGKRPNAITVTLKGSDGTSKDLTVRAPWNYEFKGLPKFDADGNEIAYTITETQPEGYTATYNGYDITNTYNPGKVNVRVVKNWVDENNKDKVQPENVTVRLLADGAEVASVELNATNKWEHTFTDLDEYKDGNKIAYTVSEDAVSNYRTNISGNAAEGFIVTNTHPTIATTATDAADNDKTVDAAEKVTIKDVVEYKNLEPGKNYTMKATLMNKATEQPVLDASGNPVTAEQPFVANNTGSGTVDVYFTDVDTRALQGQKLVAFESCEENGTEVATHADITDEDQTVEVDKPTVDIPVEKAWTKTDGTPAQPSEPIIVTLKCDGELTDNQKVLLAANEWKATFTDLPKFDTDGSEFVYEVEETFYDETRFTNVVTGSAAEGFVVTNTEIDQPGPEPEIGTTATDAADGDHKVVAEPTATVVDEVAYKNLPAGKYVMKGQLLKKSDQSELANAEKQFTVVEDYAPGTVLLTFTFDASELANTSAVAFEECYEADDNFVVAADATPIADHKEIDDPDQTVDFTDPEIGTTAADAADGDKFIPATGSATVVDTVAYTNLTVGKEYTLTGKLVNKETGATIAEGEPVTFTPETANGTVQMTFTIKDCSTIAGVSAVAYEYVGVNVKGDIKPVADHENPNDEDQTVYVPTIGTTAKGADGNKILGVGTVDVIDVVTYTNLIPNKEYTVFGQLVKQDGTPIKGATATTTFTPAEANGEVTLEFTIDTRTLQGKALVAFETLTCEGKFVADHKNPYDPAQTVTVDKPTTTVSGTKTWEGDENAPEGTRPDKVHVRLLANGTEIKDAWIPDENGSWTYEFTDLPVYDGQGVKITYTVTEDAVENYASEATATEAGVDFKNVYTPEQTSVNVTKKWNDNDNAANARPESITVKLLADGTEAATAELNANNSWTHTFNNLAVGKTYTVEEVAVQGYEGTVEGNAETGFVLTNTKPTVTTNASDEQGGKELEQAETVKVVDVITYTGLTPGKEYTLTGTLMNKATGQPLGVKGATVTVDPFIPETANGTCKMEFEIDSRALQGQAIVVFENVSYEGIEVCAHTDINDDDQTVYVPEIGTTATDSETGDHIAKADEQVTINDSVHYEGLVPGKAYTMEGTLYKKNADGSQGDALATAGKGFTAEADGEGDVVLSFTFNGSALAGASAVAFEAVKDGDTVVATHADINDADQTVDFPEAETNATNENGGKELAQGKTVKVVDKVTYTNLLPGKTYTITGTLMDKETGLPLDDPGATATTTLTLAEDDPRSGSVNLAFEINTASLQGKAIVAFETVTYNGKEVAVHADINDEDQTVYVPEIGTTATDSETGEHIAKADEQVTINDAVQYSGLVPGKEYTMVGQLHKKSDPTQTVGDAVQKTFTASATGAGEVVLTFVVDASALAGDAVVAFEAAYEGAEVAADGTPVATHEDPNDPDQTVELPKVETNALDNADDNKVVEPTADVTIVDKVTYTNLLPNKDYTVYGQLVSKDDPQHIITTATKNFRTGDDVNSTIDLEFKFNATQLQGEQVVVFETVYYKGIEVAVHADINDGAQTVTVRENGTVEISKVDITNAMAELPGARLIIEKDGKVIETWESTNEVHKVQLEPGNYILTEITAPEGYEVAESIPFAVDENGLVGSDRVVMQDKPTEVEKINVSVAKTWVGEAPGALMVQLVKDGAAEGQPVELNAGNSWSHSWTGLAKGPEYTVEEAAVAGYAQTKFSQKSDAAGNVTVEVENTKQPDEPQPGKVNVKVEKAWDLEEGEEAPAKLSVQLTRNGAPEGEPVELTAPDWTYSWVGLPKADENNVAYTYDVVEAESASYAQTKREFASTTDEQGNVAVTVSFTNKLVPEEPENPTVKISKVDAATSAELPGAELIVRDAAGNIVESWTSGTEPHEVQLAPGTYTLTEITAPDGYEKAETITFEVNESGLVNGKKVVMEDKPTPKPEPETVKVTVEKKWNLADGEEAPAVSMQLTANGAASGDPVALPIDGTWTYTWDKLPKYDENDALIDYAVTEAVPEGYFLEKSESRMNGNGDTTITFTNAKNPPEPEPEKISVTAKKLWEGVVAGQPSVTVKLTRDGAAYGDAVELTAANLYTYTWNDLPKADESGAVYNYEVTEVEPAGYTQTKLVTTMDGAGNVTTTFTNKKEPEPEPEPEIGTKATDANDGDKFVIAEPQTQIKDVVHYKNLVAGKTYRLEGELVNKKTEEVIATAWTTFVAVEGGEGDAELTFTVDTSALAGEKVVAFETVKDGRTIVAVHAELGDADQTVDVVKPTIGTTATGADGNKIIANAENVQVVDVVKYNNLTPGRTYTLTGQLVTKSSDGEVVVAENTTTFVAEENQPATTQLTFTVDTTGLPGEKLVAFEAVYYTGTKIAEHRDITDKEQTVEVTTPEEPQPEVVNIDVTKAWKTAEGADAEAGKSVVVELYANGAATGQIRVLSAPSWKATFAELAKKDAEGNEIAYTVVETIYDDDKYTNAVSGTAAEGFVVTNTEIPEPEPETIKVSVAKTWVDGDAPEALTVHLLQDGTEVASTELNAGNGWKYEWTGLEKGPAYEVTEDVPANYEQAGYTYRVDNDGNVAVSYTNKPKPTEPEPEKVNVSVVKTWVGNAPASLDVTLTKDGAAVETVQLNAENNWSYTWTGLEKASYLVEETLPTGYTQTKFAAVPDAAGNLAVSIENTEKTVVVDTKIEVLVSKTDATTKAELQGATLTITDAQGNEVITFVSGTEPRKVSLEPGAYTLTEVSAPAGYELAAPISFTVGDGGLSKGDKVTMEDQPKTENPKVVISKVDATTKAELPGAALTVTDKATGQVVETFVSGTEPTELTLAPGEYTLTEVTAPFGYKVAESIDFTVDANGLVGSAKVVMEDQPEQTIEETVGTEAMTVHKAWYNDQNIAEYVPVRFVAEYSTDGGINWTATDQTVTVTGEAVDKDGMWTARFEKLPAKVNGVEVTWRAVESKTHGYEQAISTIAGPNGMVASNLVENPGTPVAGVVISKYASDTKQLLAGAKLQLLQDGKVLQEWTSTATPYRTTLPAGTYVLHEVSAPDGYNVAKDIEFVIDQESTVDFSAGQTFDPNKAVAIDMTDQKKPSENPKDTPKDNEDNKKTNDGGKTTDGGNNNNGGSSNYSGSTGYTPSYSGSAGSTGTTARGGAVSTKTGDAATTAGMLALAGLAAAGALAMGYSLHRSRRKS